MYTISPYDVGGPGVLLVTGLLSISALTILTVIIAIIEAIVMLLFRWDKFRRSLMVSLLMNAVSTVIGSGLILVFKGSFAWLAIAFILSVLIEGEILFWMKRGMACRNCLVSLAANLASYMLVLLPISLLLGPR